MIVVAQIPLRSSFKKCSPLITSRFRHFPPRYYRPSLNGNLFQHDILRELSNKMKDPYSFESKFLQDDEKVVVAVATRNIVNMLEKNNIDYCIAGGIACNIHGYSRPTEDIDIILTSSSLEQLKQKVLYRGLVPRFRGANKSFVDPSAKVGVDILITGEFPGDGKPKPIAFPDPASCSVDIGGVKVLSLEKLIELKLASYMDMKEKRAKDLVDVLGLVKQCSLDKSFSACLHPAVRDEFVKVVSAVEEEEQRLE